MLRRGQSSGYFNHAIWPEKRSINQGQWELFFSGQEITDESESNNNIWPSRAVEKADDGISSSTPTKRMKEVRTKKNME